MCGIVGYVGGREAANVIISGLHRLEYRGYDSAGLAVIHPDGVLDVFKCKGKVDDLERSVSRAGPPTASPVMPMPIPIFPVRAISRSSITGSSRITVS